MEKQDNLHYQVQQAKYMHVQNWSIALDTLVWENWIS